MILDRPIALLRIEGFALAAAALALFLNLDGTWWWLPVLFLVPDLSAVGYLAGARVGSMTYNAAHTTTLPIVVALIAWTADADTVMLLALILLFHIGFDRAVGYGLKFPDAFGNTHLGMKGKRA